MRHARSKRLVASCAFLSALALLGLLSLDLALRRDASRTPEPAGADEETTRDRLRDALAALVSSGNREAGERQWEAARWLLSRLAELGYEVQIQQYERRGERWPNVVASRVPLSAATEHVVAMAHLDSVSGDPQRRAPGADDDGSGVTVLLEVARALRKAGTHRPIVFCFFSNEEGGSLGSQAFASWARRQKLRFPAAVNVDVVGYNRPVRLLDWSAVTAQTGWRARGRAVWLQVRNGITAVRTGADTLLVAGRPPNRGLVDRVSDSLERVGGLSVVRRARGDCG